MRKSWIIAAALTIVVALSASAIAMSSKAPIPEKTRLNFDVQPVAGENVDLGQSGESLGDQSISSLLLLQHGERVGRLDAVCSLTNLDPNTSLCHAGLRIDSGQVELMGRISGGSQGGQPRIQLSVIGGTGAYRHLATVSALVPIWRSGPVSASARGGCRRGNARPNDITGSHGADVICPRGGNDRVNARRGRDRVVGKTGRDLLWGGGGADQLVGGNGGDVLIGGGRADVLIGGRQADVLLGDKGVDRLIGGLGADVLDARDERGGDIVRGGEGADVCFLDAGDTSECEITTTSRVSAGGARVACTVSGTSASDDITGGKGAEVMCMRGGSDRAYGLGGDDRIRGARGRDELLGGQGNDRVVGGAKVDLLLGGRSDLLDKNGADTLAGRGGGDFLQGGAGADRYKGGPGGDIIDAHDGSGTDIVIGGGGRDTCFVDPHDSVSGCEVVV